MPLNAVVIVAAGRGERMGDVAQNGPKQYRKIGETSVLAETVAAFDIHDAIDWIQVVVHKDDTELYHAAGLNSAKLLPPAIGGATRQESCRLGLEALARAQAAEKVLIHDAARPFVSTETITRVLEGIRNDICALPGNAIVETIKKVNDEGLVIDTVKRDELFTAQTPQGFMFDAILDAHQKAASEGINNLTDDAAVAEWAKLKVQMVEVPRGNLKITTADDLRIADQIMKERALVNNFPDIRTGHGYDIHQLGPGTDVILCGITIPHNGSLQGHSDADVGFHSLTDAILSTIGDGDIGHHFPPTDPKWKGASSDIFLLHAVELVNKRGGFLNHADITIICEAPKIGPHREAMKERVGELTGLPPDRVSVKATTNEKLGPIGRQEGIAAIATATVIFAQQ